MNNCEGKIQYFVLKLNYFEVRDVIIKKKLKYVFCPNGGEGVRPQIQTFLDVILAIMEISSRFIWTLKTFPHSGS